jgi:hypothetical protein
VPSLTTPRRSSTCSSPRPASRPCSRLSAADLAALAAAQGGWGCRRAADTPAELSDGIEVDQIISKDGALNLAWVSWGRCGRWVDALKPQRRSSGPEDLRSYI